MAVKLNENSVIDFIRLRAKLMKELGEITDEKDIAEFENATEKYFLSHINSDLFCWGVFAENRLAAAGSLCLFERLPYKGNPEGREGYILNIYTCPEYRGCGFAGEILDDIIDFSCEKGIKRLWLDSSEKGKKLYAEKGFCEKKNEMEIYL